MLTGRVKPIVLLRLREPGVFPEAVAPGLEELGVMLPYTPFRNRRAFMSLTSESAVSAWFMPLIEKPDLTIFIGLTLRSEAPGTLYTIEIDPDDDAGELAVEMHSMNPILILRMARSLGGGFGRVLLVGCEPESSGEELDGRMGLNDPVAAAVDEAVRMVENLVRNVLVEAI